MGLFDMRERESDSFKVDLYFSYRYVVLIPGAYSLHYYNSFIFHEYICCADSQSASNSHVRRSQAFKRMNRR